MGCSRQAPNSVTTSLTEPESLLALTAIPQPTIASAAAFLRRRRIEISGINKSHCPNRLLFGKSLACKENHLVAKQESTMIGRGLRLRTLGTALLLLSALSVSGCGVVFFGAAAGGGGYETYQHDQMQKLEQEYAAGEIDQAQFEARKRRIQQSSLLQE